MIRFKQLTATKTVLGEWREMRAKAYLFFSQIWARFRVKLDNASNERVFRKNAKVQRFCMKRYEVAILPRQPNVFPITKPEA